MNENKKSFAIDDNVPRTNVFEGDDRKRYDYDDATIDKLLTEAKNEIRNETKNETERLNHLVNDLKKDYLTILGIFVSLITFVSVEIQILKEVKNPSLLIGLSSLMIGGLLLFAMTLVNFVKANNDWSNIWTPLVLTPLLLFVTGFLLFFIAS